MKPFLRSAGVLAIVLAAQLVAAQVAAPSLTETQQLQAQNLILVWQVKQLQAQTAQRDAEDAKAAVIRFATTLNREGYTLDLQTLTYQPTPAPPNGEHRP